MTMILVKTTSGNVEMDKFLGSYTALELVEAVKEHFGWQRDALDYEVRTLNGGLVHRDTMLLDNSTVFVTSTQPVDA